MSASTRSDTGRSTKVSTKGGTISVFGLILLNVTAVISLNNLPAEAEYGLSSIAYYLIAAIFFLVPVALVAAELATGWPEKGGVFRWIGEAFRGRIGFVAMFIAWVEVCVFLPTSLTFGAVSLAYINPDEHEAAALSSNPIFVLGVVLVVFWIALCIALLGSKGFATMAKWGGVIGVFIPIAVLVAFGIAYAAAGNAPQMDVSWSKLIPDFSGFETIVLAASIFLMYAGMEMNAVHVKEVKDATRNYPVAIFASAIVTVLIFVLGTLVIAWLVPAKDISLTQAILVTYFDIFRWAGIPWAGSVVAIMLAVGVLVNITTWVAGPSTGLLAVAKAGYLPKVFQKTNRHGAAVTIMLTQAVIVTLVSVLFVLLPSVQSAYEILNQLANLLYLTVYMLMFASIIRLRYTQKGRPRPFRLGKSNALVWIVAGLGFVASLAAYVFSFIPPDQINVGSPVVYVVVLVALAVVFYAIPNVIYQFRKPSWDANDPDFAPFTWQTERVAASETPTADARTRG
ncbi:MAG TPA: amino acid permease [Microbacteriaceae bacterium]|nr:amino acid permease [Actinomycetota bacterium]HOA85996.1 amino acid permease [Microbacteriaceae bacterium]HPZ33829.1 amino acid permease [Microbacteriaceae bacterium]HQE46075.1 amino acid permease [Rhodoglobus sp.]